MDINVIKQKREELNNKGGGNNDLFKPKGEHSVRIVPYKHNPKNPFVEVYWHYNVNGKHLLCNQKNFGEECPVCEFASQLWKSDEEENKELAKNLFPKVSFYSPVVIRGEEEEGVKFWKYSSTIYDALTKPFVEGEIGDFTDIETGRDIKIDRKTPKQVGNKYGKTSARVSMKESSLVDGKYIDDEKLEEILNDQKEVFGILNNSKMSTADMKKLLSDWLENTSDDKEEDDEDKKTFESKSEDKDEVMSKFDKLLNDDDDE